MTQKERDRNFEEEMKPIYAAKEALSAELNALPPEERVPYLNREGERIMKKYHLEKYSQRFNYGQPEQ